MNNCPFCSKEQLRERVIFETEDLILVSDICPVTKGHLLILSKKHLLSFGHANVKQRVEIIKIVKYIASKFSCLGNYLVFFEHGNRCENVSGRPSVDHAHAHIIPTNKQLDSLFPGSKSNMNFINLNNVVKEMSYYFFWEIFSNISFVGSDSEIESQFIRKITSNQSNNWNWRISCDFQNKVNINTKLIRRLLL